MSVEININSDPNVPTMVGEVLNSRFRVLKSLLIEPTREIRIQVPSKKVLLRLKMPSGKDALVHPLENGNFFISGELITNSRSDSGRTLLNESPWTMLINRTLVTKESAAPNTPLGRTLNELRRNRVDQASSPLANIEYFTLGHQTALLWQEQAVLDFKPSDARPHFLTTPNNSSKELIIFNLGGSKSVLQISLPGSLEDTTVQEIIEENGKIKLEISVSTKTKGADSLLSYLQRADYNSASSMADWALQAENHLFDKIIDPFAACVGGYSLLQLRKTDLLHDWPKNLADRFPNISDGCVIWGLQNLLFRDNYEEGKKYLLKAVERPLPIYTVGLRLLVEGLRRLRGEGQASLNQITERAGEILWRSPFTAQTFFTEDSNVNYDIKMSNLRGGRIP